MMSHVRSIYLISVVWIAANGCAIHNIKYIPVVKFSVDPTKQAQTVRGRIDQASKILNQAELPHNTVRERFNLRSQGLKLLSSQIGSEDYVVIGEIYGGGNGYSTLATLETEMCKKASRKGGDVVLIYDSGVQEQAYSYTTPASATTNVSGWASGSANYVYGQATGTTTYTPSKTYSGIWRFPYMKGVVFKYWPGYGALRAKAISLDDSHFERVIEEIAALENEKLTFDDARLQVEQIVDHSVSKR